MRWLKSRRVRAARARYTREALALAQQAITDRSSK